MVRSSFKVASLVALVVLSGCGSTSQHDARTQAPQAAQASMQPEMQLPPGWTQDDMQAMMAAGTPGEMHEFLASKAGTWTFQNQMFMTPGGPPMESTSVATSRVVMDGRYVITELEGEMPGIGRFAGMGIMGFDNVQQKFVGSWLDNQSTSMMQGLGTLSSDRKRMEWDYTYTCPITKSRTVMREVDTFPDANTMIMEMFARDPKSGVEYKHMHMVAKRTR